MAVSSAETGLRMSMKNRSAPDVARLIRSLYFLAMLLGSISPTKNAAMVVMIVDRVSADTPHMRVTCTVTMEAAAMCMIFVQISMVVIARSKLSVMKRAFLARSSPLSASVFSFTRDTEANAVSAMAKYMAPNRRSITISQDNRLPSSIKDVTLLCLCPVGLPGGIE